MADYTSVTLCKDEMAITHASYDAMLALFVAEVTSWIDKYCKRTFNQTTETRYFDGKQLLIIDDLISVTSIKLDEDGDGTFETTLASTDYHFYPLNETPKTRVRVSHNSTISSFANGIPKGVEIAATWGYDSTVPVDINRVAKIQVIRLFKRREVSYATHVASEEFGEQRIVRGLDPDVRQWLANFVRWE